MKNLFIFMLTVLAINSASANEQFFMDLCKSNSAGTKSNFSAQTKYTIDLSDALPALNILSAVDRKNNDLRSIMVRLKFLVNCVEYDGGQYVTPDLIATVEVNDREMNTVNYQTVIYDYNKIEITDDSIVIGGISVPTVESFLDTSSQTPIANSLGAGVVNLKAFNALVSSPVLAKREEMSIEYRYENQVISPEKLSAVVKGGLSSYSSLEKNAKLGFDNVKQQRRVDVVKVDGKQISIKQLLLNLDSLLKDADDKNEYSLNANYSL